MSTSGKGCYLILCSFLQDHRMSSDFNDIRLMLTCRSWRSQGYSSVRRSRRDRGVQHDPPCKRRISHSPRSFTKQSSPTLSASTPPTLVSLDHEQFQEGRSYFSHRQGQGVDQAILDIWILVPVFARSFVSAFVTQATIVPVVTGLVPTTFRSTLT